MKFIVFLVGVVLAGLAAWNLGGRMSIDAITLAIGLIFGVLSGIPTVLLILGVMARQPQPRRGGWDDGFDAGIRQAQRAMLEYEGREVRRLVGPVIDVQPAARYTIAHPFEIAGHIEDRSG